LNAKLKISYSGDKIKAYDKVNFKLVSFDDKVKCFEKVYWIKIN
jgi:hypothetical protein